MTPTEDTEQCPSWCFRPEPHDGPHRSFDDIVGEGANPRASSPTVALLVAIALLALIALAAVALLRPARAASEERHEYHGVTWIGNDCRVIEQGTVVICLVTETA